MLRVTPIRYTHHFEEWARLLTALGMVQAVASDGWREFDSHSGSVRLHAADDVRTAGTTDLWFEVGDLDEFARRTAEAGGAVRITDEAHGRTATVTGPDGVALGFTVEQRPPSPGNADPLVHVLGFWYSADPVGAADVLKAIGARLDITNDAGTWTQAVARNGGLVACHVAGASKADLSFQYDGEVDALVTRLRDAGLRADLIDEAYGRTVLVANPDGGDDVAINEAQTDLHGYRRS